MISRNNFFSALIFSMLLLGIVLPWVSKAQTAEQQQVISVLTLNLARFTEWPEQGIASVQDEINLCVLGGNIVQQSFELVDQSLVNNRRLQVVNMSRLRNIEQCQILYISELEHNKLLQLLLELERKPVLTVGENIEFVRLGGMVGFENIAGKIQLNINLKALKRSGLVVSSRILKLARIVE